MWKRYEGRGEIESDGEGGEGVSKKKVRERGNGIWTEKVRE